MILRTPLGHPPLIDYGISVIIMLAFIILMMIFALRVFKVGSYIYDRSISLKEIFSFASRG